jgi:hypothetical protein
MKEESNKEFDENNEVDNEIESVNDVNETNEKVYKEGDEDDNTRSNISAFQKSRTNSDLLIEMKYIEGAPFIASLLELAAAGSISDFDLANSNTTSNNIDFDVNVIKSKSKSKSELENKSRMDELILSLSKEAGLSTIQLTSLNGSLPWQAALWALKSTMYDSNNRDSRDKAFHTSSESPLA